MNVDGGDPVFVALIDDIRVFKELDDRQESQRDYKRIVDSLNEYLPDNSIGDTCP